MSLRKIASPLKIAKTERVVKLDDLNVDPSYQREVKDKHRLIVTDFNPIALGIPLIGQREDRTLWIVDGLQRCTALKKLGYKTVKVEVFQSEGPEHEAAVFKLVNINRTKLNPQEEFRALLTAHDDTAWLIKDTVEKAGFKLQLNASSRASRTGYGDEQWKWVACTNTLQSVVKRYGPDHLAWTLDIVKRAWPGDKLATCAQIIGGMAVFYDRKGKMVDDAGFITRLQRVSPHKVVFAAQQATLSGKIALQVADQLEKVSRRRLSSKFGT